MTGLPAIFVEDADTTALARIRLRATCSRTEAAMLCGIEASTFDDWRSKGIVPPPIAGTSRYSTAAILRRLEGEDTSQSPPVAGLSPFAEWKARRDESRANGH